MTTKTCRVKCRAKDGLFDDERVVRLWTVQPDGERREVQCLAYGDAVELKGEPDPDGESLAELRVYCIGHSSHTTAIVLSQSTFQNGPSVFVANSEIIEGPGGM